jgi:hypothetical protein
LCCPSGILTIESIGISKKDMGEAAGAGLATEIRDVATIEASVAFLFKIRFIIIPSRFFVMFFA